MIIAKFGGTSVSTKENIATIVKIIEGQLNRKPVVVVSALSGITDLLIKFAKTGNIAVLRQIKDIHYALIKGIWREKSKALKVYDYIDSTIEKISSAKKTKNNDQYPDLIVSFGEIMSSYIVANAITSRNILAKQVIATDIIVTDNSFGNAEFLPRQTQKKVDLILKPLVKKGITPVVTGFIGKTIDGKTTTLGRGGSDYSASIIGNCLSAEEIQIWTDVNGIMTADPRIVKDAKPIDFISYEEAAELSILGAKVLHPKTILPAIEKNIPVRILNTFNPNHKGTMILGRLRHVHKVVAITSQKGIKLVNIRTPNMFRAYGFFHKLFKIFDDLKISVDFVSTSEVSVSLTINGKYDTKKLLDIIGKFAEIEVKNHRASVSVIGKPNHASPVMPSSAYVLLEIKKIDVEMISAGASKVNETIIVKEENADEAVRILHNILVV